MAQGVLVTRDWAKWVDESLRDAEKTQLEKKPPVGGLFYELRPAVLASSWTQNAAGLYVATAQFVVNDTVDSSFSFDVCAPTATDDPGGTVGVTRFFVVWRGRWEMVAGAGADVEITTTSDAAVTGFSVVNNAVIYTTSSFITSVETGGNGGE